MTIRQIIFAGLALGTLLIAASPLWAGPSREEVAEAGRKMCEAIK